MDLFSVIPDRFFSVLDATAAYLDTFVLASFVALRVNTLN
jgi:hypothetical protein